MSTNADTPVVASPAVSVQKARATRRGRRATRPMHVAAMGRKSGLTAMAPTMRMPLL